MVGIVTHTAKVQVLQVSKPCKSEHVAFVNTHNLPVICSRVFVQRIVGDSQACETGKHSLQVVDEGPARDGIIGEIYIT